MRRLCALAIVLLAGCNSASGADNGKLVDHQDLAAIVAVPVHVKAGVVGGGIQGLTVNGSVINHESVTMACEPAMFELVSGSTRRHAVSGYCNSPTIEPNGATEFSVTFPALSNEASSLRLDHPDGTYELKDLAIPPPP